MTDPRHGRCWQGLNCKHLGVLPSADAEYTPRLGSRVSIYDAKECLADLAGYSVFFSRHTLPVEYLILATYRVGS